MEKVDWQDRKFYTVDIQKHEISDIAQKLIDILSKDKVCGGQALKYAEEIYKGKRKKSQIEKTIPEAWKRIVSDPESLLVDLLVETTEKLCGIKPDDSMVKEFLSSHQDNFLLTEADSSVIKSKVARRRIDIKSKSTVSLDSVSTMSRNLGRKGYRQIQHYIIPVVRMMRQGISHTEAFQKSADAIGVSQSTVRSQCTRQLGKTIHQFVTSVSDGSIVSFLKKRYPREAEIIEKELGK